MLTKYNHRSSVSEKKKGFQEYKTGGIKWNREYLKWIGPSFEFNNRFLSHTNPLKVFPSVPYVPLSVPETIYTNISEKRNYFLHKNILQKII